MPGCVSQWHLSSLTGAFFIVMEVIFLATILYSYTPEEIEELKARLKQAEERAAFFEKAWLLEHNENFVSAQLDTDI